MRRICPIKIRGAVCLFFVILAGWWMPTVVRAEPPAVRDTTNTLAIGAKTSFYLCNFVTWTDNVYSLQYSISNFPAHGTLSGYPGPFINYQASNDSEGNDTFTWYVSLANGSETSAVATCTAAVMPNHAPVANPMEATIESGRQGSPLLWLSSYVTHDSMDQGQTMTYLIMSQPQHGTANWNSQYAQYGAMDYVSAPQFMGTDTFTWAVSDGFSSSAEAQIKIVVTPYTPYPMSQTAIAATNIPLIIYPSYIGGAGYTCSVVRVSGPSYGSLVVTNDLQFCYTPQTDYTGSDSFQWKVSYWNEATPLTDTAVVTCQITVKSGSTNADWTQWRFDECRTAQSPAVLPGELHLLWRRDVPAATPSFTSTCLDADYCRPVQLGKKLFVSLKASDSVTAYDTESGAQAWRYYTGGALRRPPAAAALGGGTNVVIFGCDDGYVYCLNAADGSERWKFRGAPNSNKAMGFGRLGSVWPVWASPVIYDGKVYFVAGYLPSWCLWGYCLEAATGAVIWKNDGQLMEEGRNSAFGPAAISYDHSMMFVSIEGHRNALAIDRTTGKLVGHTGYGVGHNGGASYWFIDGSGVNSSAEPSTTIAVGGRSFDSSTAARMGVSGTVGNMLAGDGKLFVVTTNGNIYCYGGSNVTPSNYPYAPTPLSPTPDGWTTVVSNMLSRDDLKQGLALVWGIGSGRMVEELALQAGTNIMVVACDPDPVKVRNLRVKMDGAGLSGARVSTVLGSPMDSGFAPYQAALIGSEDVNVAGYASGAAMVEMLYNCTRPFGGEIWLPTMDAQHTLIDGWVGASTDMPLSDVTRRSGYSGIGVDGMTQIRRLGLPDNKQEPKPPFGVIAFGEAQYGPLYATYGVPSKGVKGGRDIYTWLPVSAAMTGYEPPAPGYNNAQSGAWWYMYSSVYNPIYDCVDGLSYLPGPGSCSQYFRYGNIVVSPGKLGGFGDLYSGVNRSGYWGVVGFPEMSGCGAGCFAANGVVAIAGVDFCTCNLGMAHTQLAVASRPDEENYFYYRPDRLTLGIQEIPIRRIGVNLGGVNDRCLPEESMVWTHHPSWGRCWETIPLVPLTYRGSAKSVYHHSAQMEKQSGRSHAWVAASQVTGLDGVTIPLAMPAVSRRTTTAPVLDGVLTDNCWIAAGRANIPASSARCGDATYVMFCYDDVNLYIGAQAETQGGDVANRAYGQLNYIKVALNSRERTAGTVAVLLTESYCRSIGIETTAWQGACYTPGTSPKPVFTAEIVIPWATLEAVGLWKEQLIMNTEITGAALNGHPTYGADLAYWMNGNWMDYLSPIYMDAAGGLASVAKPHTVRLYFAEMEDKTATQRKFDVNVQGQTVLTNLDVVAEAGGPRRELMKEFQNVGIADKLDIDFVRKNGEPMLSGVEIMATYNDGDISDTPPVAIADINPLSGPPPLTVTLTGRRSYDPDGQITQCSWNLGDGHAVNGSLNGYVYNDPGTYQVTLTVTDTLGATCVTSKTVTVTSGIPLISGPFTTHGTNGAAFGYQITASGSPTSYGAIGLPAGLSIDTGNGLISGTPTAAGTSAVTILAVNADGTGTAELVITVCSASAVTAAITSPANGSYTTNAAITVNGTASSSGAMVTGVTLNGAAASTSNGYTNWTKDVTLATGGTNLLVAVASDANGSATVTSRVIYADAEYSTGNDGVPDSWKIQNWGFGFATNPDSDALADPDGDGFDNEAEFKAGTSPSDRTSRLFIDEMAPAGMNFAVQWFTVSGKYYLVQYSSNLLDWLDAGSSNKATSSVSDWTDDGTLTGGTAPGQAGKRFYRIKIP